MSVSERRHCGDYGYHAARVGPTRETFPGVPMTSEAIPPVHVRFLTLSPSVW